MNNRQQSRSMLWVLAIAAGSPLACAQVFNLPPTHDTSLSSPLPNANGGSFPLLAVEGWIDFGALRAMLKFDLTQIPDDHEVISASLTLSQIGDAQWSGFPVELWRMPSDNWTETTATWNSYDQTGGVAVCSLNGPQSPGLRVFDIKLADWDWAADLLDNTVTFQARWGDELSQHYKKLSYSSKEGVFVPALSITVAPKQILGQHHFTWWDDPQLGVMVTPQGAPPPTPASIALLNVDEWHLGQQATTDWYNGLAVPGLPPNPFNAANRNGMTSGSVIPVITNAEGFVYQVTNLNYFNGNGPPPFQTPPFSFTSPPGGFGQNDLSGITITDTHGALNISPPAPGSQFMCSTNLVVGTILDLTSASVGIPASQDWDLTTLPSPGAFEWDINTEGIGASAPLPPIVFGYAMPGHWLDKVNQGLVHSWYLPVGPPVPVNITPNVPGFSGPAPMCYADCDADSVLSIDDFICFQTMFAIASMYADCDLDAALSIDDFICFQTYFAIGC